MPHEQCVALPRQIMTRGVLATVLFASPTGASVVSTSSSGGGRGGSAMMLPSTSVSRCAPPLCAEKRREGARSKRRRCTRLAHARPARGAPRRPARLGGCFADAGFTAMRSARYDRAAAGMTPLEVIREETRAIRSAFGGGLVPQDGARGGRDLRLHIGGDAPTEECASELGAAVGDWRARGGGDAWSYTHAWRGVKRAAWGGAVAVLASIEHEADVAPARAQGYAPAIVVAKFPRAHRAFELGSVRFVPCLAEVRKTTCVECRLCFRDDLFERKIGIAFQLHGQHDARGLARLRGNAATIAEADRKRRAPLRIVG